MSRHFLTKPAETDLLSVWQYIATDHPQAADAVLDLIGVQCNLLASNPKIGQPCDALAKGLLSFPIGRASWRSQYVIFYRPCHEGIEVIRILEGHQNIDKSYFSIKS